MDHKAPVILVADDDDGIRNLMALCLEGEGYQVITARDGCQALALWKRHRMEIDLVITDIEMPEMSGLELVDRLNRRHAGIPILIISGSGGGPPEVTGGNCPPRFLAKPFDLCALTHMVASLISAAPHRAGAVS
jgi:CheY-like chemotaxis protein